MITFKASILTSNKSGEKAQWHINDDLWNLDEIHKYVYGINESWVSKHQNGYWVRINAETLDNIYRYYMDREGDDDKKRMLHMRWVFNALRDVVKGRTPYIYIGDVQYETENSV